MDNHKYLKYKIKYLKLCENNIQKGGKIKNEDRKKFKKFFISLLPKIKYYEIILKPFLEKVADEYIKLPIIKNKSYVYENSKINKLFISRIKKDYNNIISNIFHLSKYKYKYNKNTNTVSLFYKPDILDFEKIIRYMNEDYKQEYNIQDVINLYKSYFSYNIINGPDGWLSGNVTYIKKNEVDEFEYTINNNYLDSKFILKKADPV